ncbi:MAG: hypothetical protein ACOCP1_04070 [Campylobacterales bacterium]
MNDSFRTLDKQVLSLYQSVIYFTYEELLSITKSLELSISSTSKERLIKSLVEEAIKSEKTDELKTELQKVALKRYEAYKRALEISNCSSVELWTQKIDGFIKFLDRLEKRG